MLELYSVHLGIRGNPVMLGEHLNELFRSEVGKTFKETIGFCDCAQGFFTHGNNTKEAQAFDLFAFLQAHCFFNALEDITGFEGIPFQATGYGFGAFKELGCGHGKGHHAGHYRFSGNNLIHYVIKDRGDGRYSVRCFSPSPDL
jgi:hypothetical protein